MTEDQLVEDIFAREGTRYEEPPKIDQPTAPGGIIRATLSEYLDRPATLAELKALTMETATPIVRWRLRTLAKATRIAEITFEPLRLQMIDFAYNSGPGTAVRWLQRVLRVADDGRIGPATLWALSNQDGFLVNQALVAARLQMIDMWTDANAQRKAWEEGLESRGLLFSLLDV